MIKLNTSNIFCTHQPTNIQNVKKKTKRNIIIIYNNSIIDFYSF